MKTHDAAVLAAEHSSDHVRAIDELGMIEDFDKCYNSSHDDKETIKNSHLNPQ